MTALGEAHHPRKSGLIGVPGIGFCLLADPVRRTVFLAKTYSPKAHTLLSPYRALRVLGVALETYFLAF
jgi:hypothetical protein